MRASITYTRTETVLIDIHKQREGVSVLTTCSPDRRCFQLIFKQRLLQDISCKTLLDMELNTNQRPQESSYARQAQRTLIRKSSSNSSMASIRETSFSGSTTSIDSTLNKDAKPLTVNSRWKVETELAEKQNRTHMPSRIVPVIKWIGTVFTGLALLTALAASKFSILGLSRNLGESRTSASTSEARIETTKIFLMLVFVLLTPNILNFLRAVWVGGFRKDLPWPTRRSVLLGMFSAALESFSLCLIVLKVLTYYDAAVGLLLLNTVFLLPCINNLWNAWRTREKESSKTKTIIMFSVGVFFLLFGLILVMYTCVRELPGDTGNIWHVIVALLCLSVTWMPAFQNELLKSNVELECNTETSTLNPPISTLNTASTVSSGFASINSTQSTISGVEQSPKATYYKRATWKMSIISHSVKIASTLFFSFIIFYLDDSIYTSDDRFTDQMHKEFLQAWEWTWDDNFMFFILNICLSLIGYGCGFSACHMCMQKLAFAIPLFISTPAFIVTLTVEGSCQLVMLGESSACSGNYSLWMIILAAVCLVFGQVLSVGWFVFRSQPILLQKESQIFWMPSFNGVLLEQWLFLNKRTELTQQFPDKATIKTQRGSVYICTTMYRETDYEMRQLLESINRINLARKNGHRFFESHIIFDGGVRKREVSQFALQLLSLVEPALGINPDNCTKVLTPYGMKLSWNLPTGRGQRPMTFNVHLKDNLKVKNKKRWSQVMYMSYVLDFLMDDANDEECFILTTDADVMFTPYSVEALLDLMTRDNSVGAVCARTHPLGSGPLVWYQVFEYAIGHWFQKAAEHVIGSVLCAPGCFSVYRCKALKDVLPIYATGVEHAFDFLTKDMGEDRWLCTLLVQSGWRIEYCAASENSTHCPEEFEEFYKQRRRWIASTLANLMLLVKEWKLISHFNPRVSPLFILYQGALLFSTLIGPSTVILVVSGGLVFAWEIDAVASVVLQLLISIGMAVICLYTSDKFQMQAAKVLTFLYAIVMTAVVVGTAEQLVSDLDRSNGTSVHPHQDIHVDLSISVTTLYLICLAGMFILGGLLHPKEIFCLVNGIWYLLCLPSGYLVLNIYSICNITDRSWGTREERTVSSVTAEPWQSRVKKIFQHLFFCCGKSRKDGVVAFDVEVQTPASPGLLDSVSDVSNSRTRRLSQDLLPSISGEFDENESCQPTPSTPDGMRHAASGPVDDQDDEDPDDVYEEADVDLPIAVGEWLPLEFRVKYEHIFRKHGFDNTMFIAGMSEKELKDIGIKTKTHLQFLLDQINVLPAFEIEYEVPSSVVLWLQNIGLYRYQSNFQKNQIRRPKDLCVLKSFGRKEIEKELHITKAGHIKRLMYAIRKLRNPSEAEKKANEMKWTIDMSPTHFLRESNIGEFAFWEKLKAECIKPRLKAFGIEEELKSKLGDLRNSWLLILAVSNTLWLILITTLASKANLTVLGANPLGLSFLILFGAIFAIQFLSMLVHRLSTLSHFLARAPYKCGAPFLTTWAFSDQNLCRAHADSDLWDGILAVRSEEKRIRVLRHQQRVKESRDYIVSEKTPLIDK